MEKDLVLDDAVILVFRAPFSYTGEDVVEISCHGGLLILERILKLCFENGARLAKRGEFTKRAFLNGKISLTQAESVMEIVNADNMGLLNSAIKVKNGELFKKSDEIVKQLVEIQASICVFLDYPEEDLEDVDIKRIKNLIKEQINKLKKLLDNNKFEPILRKGVNVVILGKPNVGKSTLMNMICNEERSIVSEICGTTRDVLTHTVLINGVNFIFHDTAGIRKTKDKIEQMGVLKTLDTIKKADILIFVADDKTKEQDFKVLKDYENYKKVLVYNKIDLAYDTDKFNHLKFDLVLKTSYKQKDSVENLKESLFKIKELNEIMKGEEILILNTRQKKSIKKAIVGLKELVKMLTTNCLLDAVSCKLEGVVDCLLELSGKQVSELVVEEIFSKFCVGK